LTEVPMIQFVRKHLIVEGLPCSRHCSKPTRFHSFFEETDRIVGAYVCPDNFVSRIVYFSTAPDRGWFENFLREELEGGSRIRPNDVRVATRHGFELGREAEAVSSQLLPNGLTEYYWSFYPHGDEEKANGNFLCEKCLKLFVKPISSPERVCSRHGAAK
jgi:hypothetical protein